MKAGLIAALCAVAATAASAQLASPMSPGAGPTVRADTQAWHAASERLADANSAESLKR